VSGGKRERAVPRGVWRRIKVGGGGLWQFGSGRVAVDWVAVWQFGSVVVEVW
jgi:hypothetical protein